MPDPCPTGDLRSPCPIAALLDVLGDRWTLLVLRDAILFEKSLFQEFQASPEGISSNTLADRLKRLEEHGILVREVYQERPLRHRYLVTPKGRELLPILREAILWGARHVPGTYTPSDDEMRRLFEPA